MMSSANRAVDPFHSRVSLWGCDICNEHDTNTVEFVFQQHVDKVAEQASLSDVPRPRIFVSYSSEEPDVTAWIRRRLVPPLKQAGIDVISATDKQPVGADLIAFESQVSDVDYNVIICTPNAYLRFVADFEQQATTCGYGFEIARIIERVAHEAAFREKVIPIILKGDSECIPRPFRGRVWLQFSVHNDTSYYRGAINLIATLRGLDKSNMNALLRAFKSHVIHQLQPSNPVDKRVDISQKIKFQKTRLLSSCQVKKLDEWIKKLDEGVDLESAIEGFFSNDEYYQVVCQAILYEARQEVTKAVALYNELAYRYVSDGQFEYAINALEHACIQAKKSPLDTRRLENKFAAIRMVLAQCIQKYCKTQDKRTCYVVFDHGNSKLQAWVTKVLCPNLMAVDVETAVSKNSVEGSLPQNSQLQVGTADFVICISTSKGFNKGNNPDYHQLECDLNYTKRCIESVIEIAFGSMPSELLQPAFSENFHAVIPSEQYGSYCLSLLQVLCLLKQMQTADDVLKKFKGRVFSIIAGEYNIDPLEVEAWTSAQEGFKFFNIPQGLPKKLKEAALDAKVSLQNYYTESTEGNLESARKVCEDILDLCDTVCNFYQDSEKDAVISFRNDLDGALKYLVTAVLARKFLPPHLQPKLKGSVLDSVGRLLRQQGSAQTRNVYRKSLYYGSITESSAEECFAAARQAEIENAVEEAIYYYEQLLDALREYPLSFLAVLGHIKQMVASLPAATAESYAYFEKLKDAIQIKFEKLLTRARGSKFSVCIIPAASLETNVWILTHLKPAFEQAGLDVAMPLEHAKPSDNFTQKETQMMAAAQAIVYVDGSYAEERDLGFSSERNIRTDDFSSHYHAQVYHLERTNDLNGPVAKRKSAACKFPFSQDEEFYSSCIQLVCKMRECSDAGMHADGFELVESLNRYIFNWRENIQRLPAQLIENWRVRRKVHQDRLEEIVQGLRHITISKSGQVMSEAVFKVPDSESDFVGRADDLRELLSLHKSSKTVSIAGMGGKGKTALAVRYAHKCHERGDYQCVYFIPSSSAKEIETSLRSLIRHCGVDDSELSCEEVFGSLSVKLQESYGDFLLIFDGLDTYSDETYKTLKAHGFFTGERGKALITSRDLELCQEASSMHKLDVLSPEDAAAYMCLADPKANREHAVELAERLGNLPLCLRLAKAIMRKHFNNSVEQFLDEYKKHYTTLELPFQGSSLHHLSKMWELCKENIAHAQGNSPLAVEFFEFSTLLAEGAISKLLIEFWVLSRSKSSDSIGPEWKAVATTLERYDLVTTSKSGDEYMIHPFLREVIRKKLKQSDKEAFNAYVNQSFCLVETVTQSFSYTDVNSWHRIRKNITHIDHILNQVVIHSSVLADINIRLGRVYLVLGSYFLISEMDMSLAIKYLEKSKERYGRCSVPVFFLKALAHMLISGAYIYQGDSEKAKKYVDEGRSFMRWDAPMWQPRSRPISELEEREINKFLDQINFKNISAVDFLNKSYAFLKVQLDQHNVFKTSVFLKFQSWLIQWFGPDSENSALNLFEGVRNLFRAKAEHHSGKIDEAYEIYQQARQIFWDLGISQNHPLLAVTNYSLADCLVCIVKNRRYGNYEKSVQDLSMAETLAETARESLYESYALEYHRIRISASISCARVKHCLGRLAQHQRFGARCMKEALALYTNALARAKVHKDQKGFPSIDLDRIRFRIATIKYDLMLRDDDFLNQQRLGHLVMELQQLDRMENQTAHLKRVKTYLYLGRLYVNMGLFQEARDLLKNAQKFYRQHLKTANDLYGRRERVLKFIEELDQRISVLKMIQGHSNLEVKRRLEKALRFVKKEQLKLFTAAILEINKDRKTKPDLIRAHVDLGTIIFHTNDYESSQYFFSIGCRLLAGQNFQYLTRKWAEKDGIRKIILDLCDRENEDLFHLDGQCSSSVYPLDLNQSSGQNDGIAITLSERDYRIIRQRLAPRVKRIEEILQLLKDVDQVRWVEFQVVFGDLLFRHRLIEHALDVYSSAQDGVTCFTDSDAESVFQMSICSKKLRVLRGLPTKTADRLDEMERLNDLVIQLKWVDK